MSLAHFAKYLLIFPQLKDAVKETLKIFAENISLNYVSLKVILVGFFLIFALLVLFLLIFDNISCSHLLIKIVVLFF